ncbi:MAG: hypothetical protein QF864_04640, partial [SAR202 cluster bacterium]|nr:hypothetical protein [SAR202 cluster bacterium]
ELKLNPFGALWDKPDISFEIGISNKVALEFVLSARYGAAGTGSSISVGGQTISEPKKKGIGLMVVGNFLNPFEFSGFSEKTYYGMFAGYNRLLIYDPNN